MEVLNKQWFVAKTRAKQEKAIQQRLNETGIESFLPTRMEVRQWHDRKKRIEVALIPNTVFIYTDKNTALSLPNSHNFPIKYMIDCNSRSLLIVPDKQMQDFIFLLNYPDDILIEENHLLLGKGDKVKVIKGLFSGVEGELIRTEGKNKVLVRLENLIACSIEVPVSYLERK
jgi:transcription antitermination factor NusG